MMQGLIDCFDIRDFIIRVMAQLIPKAGGLKGSKFFHLHNVQLRWQCVPFSTRQDWLLLSPRVVVFSRSLRILNGLRSWGLGGCFLQRRFEFL